jgi:hypothetical protein
MDEPRIFFMHIAKTAGSSVNKIFSEIYRNQAITHIEGKPDWNTAIDQFSFISGHIRYPVFARMVKGVDFKYITFVRDPIEHLRSHLNWVRIQTIDPKHKKFVERNPAIWRLSKGLWKVNLSDAKSILFFLEEHYSNTQCKVLFQNCQCRYFINIKENINVGKDEFRNALGNMNQFEFVGISEKFDQSMKLLFAKMGLRDLRINALENVESYDRQYDRESFREVLSDYIGYDCGLYELALTRFHENSKAMLKSAP